MSSRVRIVVDAGTAVAAKTTDEPGEIERLAREARWLRQAAHPGLIELRSFQRSESGAELRTSFGGKPLTASSRLGIDEIAGVVAAVADTVADLHELGIVHGRLGPSHILIGSTGRPRICGLSGAAAISEGALPADDVEALGRLLADLLHESEVEIVPKRRISFTRRARTDDAHRRALLTLADHAMRDEPHRRPSARSFAAAVQATVPSAVLSIPPPETPAPAVAPPPASPPRPRAAQESARRVRWTPLVLVAVAIAVVLTQVAAAASRGSGVRAGANSSQSTLSGPPDVAPTPSTSAGPEAAVRPAPTDGRRCPARPGGARLDATGDGCPDHIAVAGARIEVGSRHYELGGRDDVVVVGDWDCDGVVTPALLRHVSGDVFVFDEWARPGRTVTVEAVAQVAGARTLAVETVNGCDRLLAVGSDGAVVISSPKTTRHD